MDTVHKSAGVKKLYSLAFGSASLSIYWPLHPTFMHFLMHTVKQLSDRSGRVNRNRSLRQTGNGRLAIFLPAYPAYRLQTRKKIPSLPTFILFILFLLLADKVNAATSANRALRYIWDKRPQTLNFLVVNIISGRVPFSPISYIAIIQERR